MNYRFTYRQVPKVHIYPVSTEIQKIQTMVVGGFTENRWFAMILPLLDIYTVKGALSGKFS